MLRRGSTLVYMAMTSHAIQQPGITGLSRGGRRNYAQAVKTTVPAEQVDQVDADQEIIARVLAGDRDAFSLLIHRYSDPLFRHALGMTGSPDVAEDILTDCRWFRSRTELRWEGKHTARLSYSIQILEAMVQAEAVPDYLRNFNQMASATGCMVRLPRASCS